MFLTDTADLSGYALDHPEFPCYLLWPRGDQEEYWLVDTMTDGPLKLSTETYFRPLGLHDFYDAFSLEGKANLRQDALTQFQLAEEELTSNLRQQLLCFECSEANTKSNPKLLLLVQQRRDRIPQGVIAPEQGEEEHGDQEEEASESCTESEESSDEQNGSPQDTRTPLSEDSHQHGFMLAPYRDVGNDYAVDKEQLKKELMVLQDFESVPRRWPLARLTVPLLKSVDHLDRVLAGCCWEVPITRQDPDDLLDALRQAARSLTLTLASYLLNLLPRPYGAPLTDEENIHLLGANY